MKLLIVINSLACGGAERVTVKLANRWAGMGWEVTVVTLSARDTDFYILDPAVKRICVGLIADSKGPISAIAANLQRAWRLRKVLMSERPDVAMAMMSDASVRLAIAAKGLPIPVVCCERTHPPKARMGRAWQLLRNWAYRSADGVVALTEESRAWIAEKTGASSVHVVPNPVTYPLPSGTPVVDPRRGEHGARKRILGVGRLVPVKGFSALISAFDLVKPKHQDWELVIVGEGKGRPALEEQIREKQLNDKVFLIGRAGNVGDWYESASIYVMTSRYEGFPNTLIEAMSYGVPVISFDCDAGPRSIIRHGHDGLLIPLDDVEALAKSLDELMNDAERRDHFSKNAKEVHKRFSEDRIYRMWDEVINDVRQVA